MPGTTTADLSSNWKKLQAKLQAEKKPADSAKTSTTTATGNGIKRKRPVEKTSSTGKPAPRYIKAKLTGDNTSSLGKKRKMGSTMSSSTTEQPAPKPHSSLMTDHDIPAADLAAAYGSSVRPNSSSKANANSMFDDTINGGLHPSHRAGKYLALDCEMVGTGPPPHTDDLLARVSLVNFHGEQIYDSYVLPPSKNDRVGDYRTHVSGITPWHLRPGYARPFLEVQRTVADLLNDKILVGHALKKDMEALQLTHPKRDVRDTSRYAPFRVESRGKPPALRNLAKSELGLVIQTGEHSSVEDARATMALFRKEKQGFEEDNRRTFGTKRRVPLGKGKREESVEKDSDEEDEDSEDDEDMDEEDLDLLEGEEDPFAGMDDDGTAAKKKKAAASTNKKKKKKKKSRTKRK